jgi:hypothetical protein
VRWEIIEPLLPLIKEPGRSPKHPFRDIVDATLYLDRSGCSWRQLPVDFPPWQPVYGWFQRGRERGVTQRILPNYASRSAKTALLSVYLFTPIRFVFADQGFPGRLNDWAARTSSRVDPAGSEALI